MNLSYEELVIACRNIGYDLTCGACAEIFYTGATSAGHSCFESIEAKLLRQPAKRQPMNGPVSGPAVELLTFDTGEGIRNAFLPELEVKQWLIYRKDLNVRRGKIIAQCAHASMKVFFDNRIKADGYVVDGQLFVDDHTMYIALNEEMKAWADGLFGKVVLTVADLDNLLLLAKQAEEAGLPVAVITDAGRTEFHGVPTITAIAIGPARCEDAWPIVRDGEVQTKLD